MVTSKQTSLDRRRAVCNETSDTDYLKPFSHCHSKYPTKHVQLRMILREAIGSCLHHLPKEQRGLRNGRLHAELGWGGGGQLFRRWLVRFLLSLLARKLRHRFPRSVDDFLPGV